MEKYMYKPLGNGKFAKILYVESIFCENQKRGWLLEPPRQQKPLTEEAVDDNKFEEEQKVENKPYMRGQNLGQKSVRKKD